MSTIPSQDLRAFYPRSGAAVTPHDSNDNSFVGFFVGVQGNVTLRMPDDDADVVLVGAVGYQPIQTSLIKATGTTATNIVGFLPQQ